MEPLVTGANAKRTKTLWEIGFAVAGNPATPYGGNRDMCITVGSGAGETFRPWLRMATGSAILAHAVARGEIEMAFVNPSGMLTQAYRGKGLFTEPLPLRVVASYPSWDRFVCVLHERTGLKSLADVKEQRYPLHMSIREDPTHSAIVCTDQIFAYYGFSMKDVEAWGGSFQRVGGPGDLRRKAGIHQGEIDCVMDEGITSNDWLSEALADGMRPIPFEEPLLQQLEAMGWRRAVVPTEEITGLKEDFLGIDFGGWPLYTRVDVPDEMAYQVCEGLFARSEWVPWEEETGFEHTGRETEYTPMDVPLHPGAERWYREHGYL
jgi:TRAP-type uncharacterized transport system substrate-binding protein